MQHVALSLGRTRGPENFIKHVISLHKDGRDVPLEAVSDEVACDGKGCYIRFFFTLYIPNEVILGRPAW